MKPEKQYAKSYNNQTHTTYVYEILESHYNPETHQTESKRRLVGKIDPVTGEMVPTGKRGRPKGAKNKTPASRVPLVPDANTPSAIPDMEQSKQVINWQNENARQNVWEEYLAAEKELLEEYTEKRAALEASLRKKLAELNAGN